SDRSYISAERADIFPRTIYDKGTWRLDGGAIVMTSDADVTWKGESDRRFLVLRRDATGTPFLFGVDDAVSRCAELVAEPPETPAAAWFDTSTLERSKRLGVSVAVG